MPTLRPPSGGHSGVNTSPVFENMKSTFNSRLTMLQLDSGAIEYVLHVRPTVSNGTSLTPEQFLDDIGLQRPPGTCPHYQNRCWYRIVATVDRNRLGLEHARAVEQLRTQVEEFSGQLDALYELRSHEREILSRIGLNGDGLLFGEPQQLQIADTEVPLWIEDVKFPALRSLEHDRRSLDEHIGSLQRYLPLLHGTGDALENAVVDALTFLGLEAAKTQKGSTFDIYAKSKDQAAKFRLEVTGINGPVRKDSNKIGQVAQCLADCSEDERVILLANSFRELPLAERAGREGFTPDVLKVLLPLPAALMRSSQLYSMVGDVLAGRAKPQEIVNMLFAAQGLLPYA